MKIPLRLAVIAAAAWILTACATTTFTSTWKAPNETPLATAGRKIAAVFISGDESSRRVAEDTLVQRINARGAVGIAAYTLIPSAELRDMERVKARLSEAGIDGIVLMRVIEEKQKVSYTNESPAFVPYYLRFSSYWDYGWREMYEPVRVATDTVVSVETLVYSLRRDKLMWAGTSRTVNPAQLPTFVESLADAATKEMQKQGLLARS